MEITLWHGVEYGVESPVAVEDVVKSLEAHAKLIYRANDLLAELFPGLKLEPKQVSVVRLSQESPLTELFACAVVMQYQEELKKEVPRLIEALTGVHVPKDYETLVTILVMLIAVYGIGKAFETLFPGRDKTSINETRETLVERVSHLTGVAKDRIIQALNVLFTGRQHRGTVLASQKVFAPTRGQAAPRIRSRAGN